MSKKHVSKPERICLCRECGGKGYVLTGRWTKKRETCIQCEGSGRVLVSCETDLEIRAYKSESV